MQLPTGEPVYLTHKKVDLTVETPGRKAITIDYGPLGKIHFWVTRETPALLMPDSINGVWPVMTVHDENNMPDDWPLCDDPIAPSKD